MMGPRFRGNDSYICASVLRRDGFLAHGAAFYPVNHIKISFRARQHSIGTCAVTLIAFKLSGYANARFGHGVFALSDRLHGETIEMQRMARNIRDSREDGIHRASSFRA